MNVKPGDLARVIYDPTTDGKSNVGLQVLVLREAVPVNIFEYWQIQKYGSCWWCETLAPGWAVPSDNMRAGRSQQKPGATLAIPDRFLKRIEPPADGEALWRDAPIEADKIPSQPKVKEPACQDE